MITAAASAQTNYALLGAEARGRKLFQTGLVLVGASLVYLGYNARVYETLHLIQGLLIFAISFIPALNWARAGGSRFPVFEPIMLLCANAYAIPLLNGHEQLLQYAPEIITQAGWVVLAHQVAAIAVYSVTPGQPGRGRFWTEEIVGAEFHRYVLYGLVLATVYLAITSFTTWIPPAIESVLRAVCFGIGILGTFISLQRWGRGELADSERALVAFTLIVQLVLHTLSLMLINSVSLLGIALLGYISGGKKIPWVVLGVSFLIFSVLHNGKSAMREKYWERLAPLPTFTQLPAFYSEWIEFGLAPQRDENGLPKKSAGGKLLERTSLMHMLCLVVAYSPDRQPYLHGETYGYVLPQLVPRFFWPEKPRSHVATYRLSTYYGLQDEEATNATTIAFGMLAEAYANFGLWGGVALGVFWGFVLKKLQRLSWTSPMFSLAGLLMILLTAWSFGSEMTMAAWVSSLYQALIVVLGIPFALRRFFGF